MAATKPSEIGVLDDLNLAKPDTSGKMPAGSRLGSYEDAISIYLTLKQADEDSQIARAKLNAMFDGAPPYDPARLKASGQGSKTNLNFGEAQRLLDTALSAYVDLEASLEQLVQVEGSRENYETTERQQLEQQAGDLLTRVIRSAPNYYSDYIRTCTEFIKHGICPVLFDNPDTPDTSVSSMADVLIPRQSQACEERVDVVVVRRRYQLHQLRAFVTRDSAASNGWNVKETNRVIAKTITTQGKDTENTRFPSESEYTQDLIKNNDLFEGIENPVVPVLHFLVREANGKVSHFICAEKDGKDFMYQKLERFERPEQAFLFYTLGVGTNGTYHAVRGLGQRIFAHVQTSNRLRCQQIDGAMLSSSVMIQPESQRALDELQFTYYGHYSVLSPGVNIVEKAIPNLSQAVQPALEDITRQLMLNADPASIYGAGQSSPYRNELQVAADMDIATRISGSSLNLFYNTRNRYLRELVRRICKGPASHPMVKELYRLAKLEGMPAEFLKTLEFSKTKAVRSIGNGSRSDRMVALRELQAISGQFDDTGRRNLTHDIVATRVGHDLANRYAPPAEGPRQTVATKIAMMENADISQGTPVPVLSEELHGEHLTQHIPAAQELITAIDEGQLELTQALPQLQSMHDHVASHVEFALNDEGLVAIANEAKQLVQFLEEKLNNAIKAAQKLQADGAGEQQQQAGPTDADLKMQQAEVDMQIKQRKAEHEMELKERKFQQEQSIQDAKAANDLRQELAQERRVAVDHDEFAPSIESEFIGRQ